MIAPQDRAAIDAMTPEQKLEKIHDLLSGLEMHIHPDLGTMVVWSGGDLEIWKCISNPQRETTKDLAARLAEARRIVGFVSDDELMLITKRRYPDRPAPV